MFNKGSLRTWVESGRTLHPMYAFVNILPNAVTNVRVRIKPSAIVQQPPAANQPDGHKPGGVAGGAAATH